TGRGGPSTSIPRARRVSWWSPTDRGSRSMSCFRCCTDRWVRTARSRGCSSSPACPMWARGWGDRRAGWTRRCRRRCSSPRGRPGRGTEDPVASVAGEIVAVGHEFYDYAAKYLDELGARLEIPAALDPATMEGIQRMAVAAFRATECAGMARVDFFLNGDGLW